ncbi:MAG: hypothetical protein Q9218_002027 [Villophora microphyllina]
MPTSQRNQPEDEIRRSLSPHVPSVPGFTPIDPKLLSIIPFESNRATAPSGIGANNGKKRQRKVSAPDSSIPRSRNSKKSKPASVPRDDDPMNLPTTRQPLDVTVAKEEIPGDPKSHLGLQSASSEVKIEVKTCPERSPSTFLGSSRTCTEGLVTSYQTAFQQTQQPLAINGQAELPLARNGHEKGSLSKLDPSPMACEQSSSTVGTVQAYPTRATSDYGSTLTSSHDRIARDALCEVPCSPGGLPDLQPSGPVAAKPSNKTRSIPHLQQRQFDAILNDGQLDISENGDLTSVIHKERHIASSTRTIGSHPDEPILSHPGSDDTDFQAFHDFLVSDVEADPFDPEIHQPHESHPMANVTQGQAHDTEEPPDTVADSIDNSYLSDIDLLMAEEICLPSSPFIESSSPYLQSLSHGRTCSNQAQTSSVYVTANERFTGEEDVFNDDSIEIGLLDLQLPPSAQRPPPSPPSSPNLRRELPPDWVPPSTITPEASPVKSPMPRPLTGEASAPPVSKTSQRPSSIPDQVSVHSNTCAHLPFVRPPFPTVVRDRSPVVGIKASVLLRTCFRIGESLNANATALRSGQDIVLEVYVRVAHSERPPESVKQTFRFTDIFSPDKPPYLKGVYSLWKGNPVWDADAKVFLGNGQKNKMARVLGKIVKDEEVPGMEMKILSIWEVDWEDVGICKGHLLSG